MINFIQKYISQILIVLLILLSTISWGFFYQNGLTLIYNDAMSHLDIARLVFDNMQPGLSQLGSVWLPISHVVLFPFILSNELWHTGVAGAIVSMFAFVVSTIAVYKIVIHLSASKFAAFLAGAAYASNVNLLYLQSTALTEPLYLALFTLSLLFLVKYLKYNSSTALIALAFVSGVGILTRYDAWFVAVVIGGIILLNERIILKSSNQAVLGKFVLYAFPIIFAAVLWLGWNLLIFGDPFYSFVGPYSAKAQQSVIQASSGLITKDNILISTWAYMLAVARNVGLIVCLLGIIGWVVYLWRSKHTRTSVRYFMFTATLSVIIFNIIALFFGFSILNLPELHWNPSGTTAGTLFNVRYGILALPFMAIGIGLLYVEIARFRKTIFALICIVLLLQPVLIIQEGVITIQDGQFGSSAFVNQDIANSIRQNVTPGQKVLMSTSSYNAVAFKSGLDLNTYIHEGVSREWSAAITQPDKYADWVVMANDNVGEPVYESLVEKEHSVFLRHFEKVYEGKYASLYKKM